MLHKTIIDCKHYKNRISLIHARNMLGLLVDINTAKGFIVTKVGFQSGVRRFCEHYGIALKLVRPPSHMARRNGFSLTAGPTVRISFPPAASPFKPVRQDWRPRPPISRSEWRKRPTVGPLLRRPGPIIDSLKSVAHERRPFAVGQSVRDQLSINAPMIRGMNL